MEDFDKIYDLLAGKGFQNPETGKLFFPVYIYNYDPKKEYAFRKALKRLLDNLSRPNESLECLEINVWESMLVFFKESKFGSRSILDLIQEKEAGGVDVTDWILKQLNHEKTGYYPWLNHKIKEHFSTGNPKKRTYLLVHGFGASYPYIRASHFLKNTEKFVRDYKMIVFYPGEVKKDRFSLFGLLNSDNIYRVNILNLYVQNDNS